MVACALAPAAYAQGRGGGRGGAGGGRGAAAPAEDGIPVTDELTIKKCASCHAKDDKGNLTRISWTRTNPEGWEEAIKRMVRLNGLTLEPAEAKAIVKYLSNSHGISPEEAKPVMYMVEHRIQDEVIPNESVRSTCNNCHALGRVFSWHRTRAEWSLLADTHSALYQQAESAFRRNGPRSRRRGCAHAAAAAAGRVRTGEQHCYRPLLLLRHATISLDATLDFLGTNYGLHTPEWSAWRTRMRAPKITGKWLISAHVLGKGKYYGDLTIAQGAAEDEFTTQVKLYPGERRPRDRRAYRYRAWSTPVIHGAAVRSGPAVTGKVAPDDLSREMRETLWISPDQTSAEGRWFFGEYYEFGVDVKMRRVTTEPMLVTSSISIRSRPEYAGPEGFRIVGANLPAKLAPDDLDFGSGVKVKSIISHAPTEIVATVDVAADAVPGKRDVVLGLSTLDGAFAVYDKVDYIKVLPEASMARLGGDEKDVHPRGYQQFEAIAYQRGEDGKLHTSDDVELGPVDVTWSIEEFYAVFGDDDKEFVGSLDNKGLFTPNIDGPNPQRKFGRNNYGDVWVVATSKSEKDKEGKPLIGRSYLVVTVPTYIRWDQPEVSK